MMNWKGFGKRRTGSNFKEIVRNLPGGTEERTKNFSKDGRFQGRDLNPGPPERRSRSVNHFSTTFGAKGINFTPDIMLNGPNAAFVRSTGSLRTVHRLYDIDC
jgi:hypothetical protein